MYCKPVCVCVCSFFSTQFLGFANVYCRNYDTDIYRRVKLARNEERMSARHRERVGGMWVVCCANGRKDTSPLGGAYCKCGLAKGVLGEACTCIAYDCDRKTKKNSDARQRKDKVPNAKPSNINALKCIHARLLLFWRVRGLIKSLSIHIYFYF